MDKNERIEEEGQPYERPPRAILEKLLSGSIKPHNREAARRFVTAKQAEGAKFATAINYTIGLLGRRPSEDTKRGCKASCRPASPKCCDSRAWARSPAFGATATRPSRVFLGG